MMIRLLTAAVFKEKSETHLDLLSIPRSGGKMSKRLGGIMVGCKDKDSFYRIGTISLYCCAYSIQLVLQQVWKVIPGPVLFNNVSLLDFKRKV